MSRSKSVEAKLSWWFLKWLMYLSNSSVNLAIDWLKALPRSRTLYIVWEIESQKSSARFVFLGSTFQLLLSHADTLPLCFWSQHNYNKPNEALSCLSTVSNVAWSDLQDGLTALMWNWMYWATQRQYIPIRCRFHTHYVEKALQVKVQRHHLVA